MRSRDPDEITIPPDGRTDEEPPRWRRDFPVDWPQDRDVTQRDFVKFLLLTSAAFVAGQLWLVLRALFGRSSARPAERPIARADAIPVGGSLVFHYPSDTDPCLLVRVGEASFVAYDQQCTHLTCPVIPRPAAGRLVCPCHEGVFDLGSGQPLAGPPRRPLPRILLSIRDGVVFATGVEQGSP